METGGWMPRGWATETGPRPDFQQMYNMMEHWGGYPERTRANVRDSKATITFGNANEPGTRKTIRLCHDFRPYIHVLYPQCIRPVWIINEFLNRYRPTVLNIAGNRESVNPGINAWVRNILMEALCGR